MKFNPKDKENLEKFLEAIEERDDWLTLLKFGIETLLDDQMFLFDLIAKRAFKEASDDKNFLAHFKGILEDLNLKLAPGGD